MRVRTPNYYRDVILGNVFIDPWGSWTPMGSFLGWYKKTQPSTNFIDLIKEI